MATAKKKPAAKKAVRRPAAKKAAGRVKVTEEVAVSSGRVRLATAQAASDYFTSLDKDIDFISSGSAVMNCALGGGWALGRVANIVGDRSSGKTLLAIEAAANFHLKYPHGYIRYAEAESAFDERYAEALGMPVDVVDFNGDKPLETVEDFYKDLMDVMAKNKDRPILYILDSLDALSDEAEMSREITDATYGGTKSKQMSQMFRRIVRQMETQDVLLIVVSQLRDKLNAMFGEKQTRSGGRALDFYATHIVWLAELGKIKKTIDSVDRVVGVNIRARVRKNKVGLPFRECEYPILFGYGVDDMTANVEWLEKVKVTERLKEVGMSLGGYKLRIQKLRDRGGPEIAEVRQKLNAIVEQEWQRIEQKFLPKSRKYES